MTPLTACDAMYLADGAHGAQVDLDGSPHFDHLRRVVGMVPSSFERVAWLHDVVEDTDLTFYDLAAIVTETEMDALRHLTRREGEEYEQYIWRIAESGGEAGTVARAVKEADLLDNLARCLRAPWRAGGLTDRYRRALPEIQRAMVNR